MNEERNVEGDVHKNVRSFLGDYAFCIDKQVHSRPQHKVGAQIFRLLNARGSDSVEYTTVESLRQNIQNSYSK